MGAGEAAGRDRGRRRAGAELRERGERGGAESGAVEVGWREAEGGGLG
jgi:hypothetical protein